MTRAVLDTNVLISALLFPGLPSRLVTAWQEGMFVPVASSPILDEYVRALAYPKFKLTPEEISGLLEETLLPFIEMVHVKGHPFKLLADPDDARFIECALAAEVPWIVSGDADLLDLGSVQSVQIVPVRDFLNILKRER